MAKVAELDIKIGVDGSGVQTGLAAATNAVKNAQGSIGARLGGAMQQVGGSMMQAGGAMTAGITLPLVGIGIAATRASVEMNTGMANVASLIPGAGNRVKELKGNVQDLAIEMGSTTADLTGGLYQVISAFGNTADTASVLRINAMAAAGGLATTTEAINLTSAVTKGYGDTSAAAVQKASDLALLTVRLGQTNFPELAASIGRVTPLANNLGVSQEELFAAMATGSGVTGNAAEVATQMRSALKSLMAPTKGMSDLMKRLGYSNGAAMIKALGFSGAISTVVKSAASSGAPLQTLMADMEGQTLALSLAGPLADDYTAKLAAMGDAAGTTDAAFKEQTKGINATGFSFKQVKAQAEVAAQKLGDGLAPALSAAMTAAQPLIDRIVRMADAFAKLPPETQTKIVGIAAAIAALGPALMVVGGAVSGLGAIVKFGGMMASLFGTIGAGGGGIAAIAGPVGIAIAAVAALAAGIAWLWKNNEEFRVGVTAAWDAIKGAFASVATEVGPLLTQIGVLLSALWENMGPGVVSIIVTTLQSLAAVVGVVFSFIGGLIRVVTLLLKGDFAGAWKFVSVTVQQVATNVMGTLAVLWGQITSSIASFATSLYQSGLGMWNSFINGIKAAAARVGEAVGGVVAKIRAFLPGSDAKIGPLSDITASGAALMTTLAGGIASAGGAPASALQGALSGLTTGAIDVGAFRGAQAAAVDATMGEATARLQQSGDVQSTVRVYVENGNIRAEMVDVAYGVQRVAAAGA